MPFEDLEVWKRAKQLSVELYIDLQQLRDFGFKDQITRAGLSVPSNIAESVEYDSVNDKLRFLRYAKASCAELRSQIYIGMQVQYIHENTGVRWVQETQEISAMLVGLMRSLERNG